MIDDRTEKLADKDQAADGWREWLRISNALNLREQPTIITAVTEASAEPWRTTRSSPDRSGMPSWVRACRREWQAIRAYLADRAERNALHRATARADAPSRVQDAIAAPVVGYETDDGIPIDFAWPDAQIAVCLDLDADERRVLESAGWRVFADDPDAVFAALREAA